MTEFVNYRLDGPIAVATMDDGKANLMTPTSIAALSAVFDRAAADQAVLVLTGRANTFSAGYDMATFDLPMASIVATMRAGGELIAKMLNHQLPVVAACNGHAIAQGAFTLLACDVRIGVVGSGKIGLNEVAIGLTIPHYGVEIARHQLAPQWFDHATLTGALYDPDTAMRAGFLHRLVEPDEVVEVAIEQASTLAALDLAAHAGTKQRVRRHVAAAIRSGIDDELATVGPAEPAAP